MRPTILPTGPRAPILSAQKLPRFDPNNHEHRAAYATFLVTGNWPIKFYVEVPQWQNMYDMVRAKLAEHACAPIIRKMRRDIDRAERRRQRELVELVNTLQQEGELPTNSYMQPEVDDAVQAS